MENKVQVETHPIFSACLAPETGRYATDRIAVRGGWRFATDGAIAELTNPGWTPGEWLWNLRRMARVCNTPNRKVLLEQRVAELEAAMAAERMHNDNRTHDKP